MRFSLFYEMQISGPTPQTERQLFHDCVAQVVLADALGFDGVWAVEHHGLYEYAHSSAPEIFLSYVAAKTSRIAIGHGVALLPGRYNHPIRVAERAATLDILSEGRLQLGTGKSGTRVEQGAFEIDGAELEAQWEEAIRMIPRMWREPVFSHQGRFYDIPPTQIVPKPVQDPHPPLFQACSRPELAVKAGERGLGALSLAIYRDDELAARVADYRAAIARAEPIGETVTNRFCCNPACIVLPDDREACRWGLQGAQFFLRSMMTYYRTENRPIGPVRAPRDAPTDRQLDQFMAHRNTSESQLSSIIGDPAAARESVQRFVDAGVDELILVMQTGTVPHEVICRSLRTFAEEVIPCFR
ncbi:MAG: LLM class flavin-dependent oxidoreductase [Alphaproteobacteria bacterium]|nr:LLM class flavin-dependent oxidoreductase [Alphaproteobacteria bacterium]